LGKAKCLLDADDTDLLALWANETYLRDADSVIRSGIADAFLLSIDITVAKLTTDADRRREERICAGEPSPTRRPELPLRTRVRVGGVPTTR
jgi:hypothetical protein